MTHKDVARYMAVTVAAAAVAVYAVTERHVYFRDGMVLDRWTGGSFSTNPTRIGWTRPLSIAKEIKPPDLSGPPPLEKEKSLSASEITNLESAPLDFSKYGVRIHNPHGGEK